MSELPQKAKVVVIGAGIVGNSMVYHLAKLGWEDIVLVDKGPLPNPGGSTGHASNFLFLATHSKEFAEITLDSVEQYKELGVFTRCGGIEVARTEARMEEFRRLMGSAKKWGIEAHYVTPAEIKEMVPFINEETILGGLYQPDVSVVDSLQAGTLMREYGEKKGVLQSIPNTEVIDIETENGAVKAVVTDKGRIETEYVVIACGVWSPRIAKMAGATIPLTPQVHQMISVGPIDVLAKVNGEIGYPIIRDMDTFMYERQSGSDMEVGSYAHRPILVHPDDIPSIEEAEMSPTELPFTEEDFEPQFEHSLEIMPAILGDETAGIRHAINGLLSLTPDGYPLLGETTEVKNLWSAAAVWIKEGPGTGRAVAEWMTYGVPEIDCHHSDISRFSNYARGEYHSAQRTAEAFNKTYGIVHPREQWFSNRNVRVSPFFQMQQDLGAVFFETAGWERPQWYESNKKLLDEYGDKVMDRPNEWDSRWWSPIINAEHLAMRERVGMVDLTALSIFDVQGSGVVPYMEKMAMAKMDVSVGRGIYTPILNNKGTFKSDLTIMRLGKNHYRVITGGSDGPRDMKWFRDNLPGDDSVYIHDMTSAICTIGVWGPRARDLMQSLTKADMSNEAFPFGWTKKIRIDGVEVLAFRISYVGELGWEIYIPMELGLGIGKKIWDAGQEFGVVPVGIGVYGTTGRLEKGYRLMSAELDGDYNPVEAGLARPKVKKADFIGKEAYLQARAEEPAAVLCTLTVEDNTSKSGVKRYLQGGEPILTLDGETIQDAKGRYSYATSAGDGPSIGKQILLAYLPPQHAKIGEQLYAEYMAENYPVTVRSIDNTAIFDPKNERMK